MSMWIQYKKANTVNKQHHTNEYDKQLTIMSDNDDDDDESNTIIISRPELCNKNCRAVL